MRTALAPLDAIGTPARELNGHNQKTSGVRSKLVSCQTVQAWPDTKRTEFRRQAGAELCERDSHQRCLTASVVLPFLIRLAWFRCVVPRRLIVLGALDDDYLQSAIERLNVFRCVFTQDSFLTLSLSQGKGVGRHINTWARHGTSI